MIIGITIPLIAAVGYFFCKWNKEDKGNAATEKSTHPEIETVKAFVATQYPSNPGSPYASNPASPHSFSSYPSQAYSSNMSHVSASHVSPYASHYGQAYPHPGSYTNTQSAYPSMQPHQSVTIQPPVTSNHPSYPHLSQPHQANKPFYPQ
jgi:hypothetical protein